MWQASCSPDSSRRCHPRKCWRSRIERWAIRPWRRDLWANASAWQLSRLICRTYHASDRRAELQGILRLLFIGPSLERRDQRHRRRIAKRQWQPERGVSDLVSLSGSRFRRRNRRGCRIGRPVQTAVFERFCRYRSLQFVLRARRDVLDSLSRDSSRLEAGRPLLFECAIKRRFPSMAGRLLEVLPRQWSGIGQMGAKKWHLRRVVGVIHEYANRRSVE